MSANVQIFEEAHENTKGTHKNSCADQIQFGASKINFHPSEAYLFDVGLTPKKDGYLEKEARDLLSAFENEETILVEQCRKGTTKLDSNLSKDGR
ncbi:hypothetical protein SUGI_0308450 [Cryptomeria japonica]|nr:hypothetical protein SUGI_0308450 [Cryptomeria japonica]